MFMYEKKLQYPVRVSNRDVRMARNILNQYGGPDGEFSASMNYLTQRFSMPLNELKGLLTDIGTDVLKLYIISLKKFLYLHLYFSKNH